MDGACRVLHVDDDPEFAALAEEFLERRDDRFVVETAGRPSDALDRLAESRFDCVVSDYEMPERDGIELLEAVREEYPDLPFILYTGRGSEEIASEAISADVTDYLQKESGTSQFAVLANRILNAVEQYRTERALERARRRYRAVLEDPNILAGVLDADGALLEVNRTAMEYVDATVEEVRGEPIWETPWWNDETRPHIRERVERAADGNYVDYEAELTTAADDTYHVEGTIRPVTDDAGAVTSQVISARDITEREERERSLEALNDAMRALLDAEAPEEVADVAVAAAADILDLDVSTVFLYDEESGLLEPVASTDAVADLLKEVKTFGPGDSITWRAYERREATVIDDVRTDPDVNDPETDVRGQICLPLDGHGILVAGSSTSAAFGQGDLALGKVLAANIVTALEQVDRQRTVTALHDFAIEVGTGDTAEAVCERTIDAAEEILAFDRSLIALESEGGLRVAATSGALPEGVWEPLDDGVARRAYREGESVRASDVRVGGAGDAGSAICVPVGDHGVFVAVAEGADAFDEADRTLGNLLVSHAENALDHIERNAVLERQNERLAEFASFVSHDLRNPLNVAQGRLDLAREEHDGEHLTAVDRALDRMATLVDDLLALARQDERVVDTEPASLPDVAEDAWRTVETGAAALAVEAEGVVRADRNRLRQLFENLLRNALEHGGEDVTVTVGDLEGGFYVADDGVGVPPGDRDDVFDLGYSTASDGTGFGLSIVEQVADAHGWTVAVTDGADGGARFEVTGVDRVEGA
jgi:PAS domain S-box-containing protein